jgi:hypothetical protein
LPPYSERVSSPSTEVTDEEDIYGDSEPPQHHEQSPSSQLAESEEEREKSEETEELDDEPKLHPITLFKLDRRRYLDFLVISTMFKS